MWRHIFSCFCCTEVPHCNQPQLQERRRRHYAQPSGPGTAAAASAAAAAAALAEKPRRLEHQPRGRRGEVCRPRVQGVTRTWLPQPAPPCRPSRVARTDRAFLPLDVAAVTSVSAASATAPAAVIASAAASFAAAAAAAASAAAAAAAACLASAALAFAAARVAHVVVARRTAPPALAAH